MNQNIAHEESLKRMHLRLDVVAEKHETLRTKFNMAFWIGTGIWMAMVFWYNTAEPVKRLEDLSKEFRELKDKVQDINQWRFEQAQKQGFVKK